jgi:hypothetical protein
MLLSELKWVKPIWATIGGEYERAKVCLPNGLCIILLHRFANGTYDVLTAENPLGIEPPHYVGVEPLMAQAILFHLTREGNT